MEFIYVIGVIIWGIIWGYATKTINTNKGYEGGFWLGFFLGFIGLIIVACKPDNRSHNSDYESSATLSAVSREIVRENSNNKMILNGGWRCYRCGTVNPSYTGTCRCGITKLENEAKTRAAFEETKAKENSEMELLRLQKLKSYKELLDSGIITPEEFDQKKAELLKI